MTAGLASLRLDNRFARLPGEFHTRLAPGGLPEPRVLAVSPETAALLGLDPGAVAADADILAGNVPLPGGAPLAMVYAGHQFGQYVPRLGDGRAVLLGQARGNDGQLYDLHLKGAGPTPYSRGADGRAVLRSCLREFLASEALHHLGIPTTRALALVGTSLAVQRERVEPGAAMLRVSRGHVRFGHFEYFYYRERFDALPVLADHVIADAHPDLVGHTARYRLWLERVVRATASLIARWQAVGFVHGVMNTDNMSVLGETIDYGPFAFMDAFSDTFTPNHTDMGGRYSYRMQPAIGEWNVTQLVQACLPLLADTPEAAVEIGRDIVAGYEGAFDAAWLEAFTDKLGIAEPQAGDERLIGDLLARMADGGADFTRTFRALGELHSATDGGDEDFLDEFADRDAAAEWLGRWRRRLATEGRNDAARRQAMHGVNPRYVLRSWMAQQAIDRAEDGDMGETQRLLDCLRRPFDDQPGYAEYAAPPPDWGRGIVLSCSS
ncbi:protein adenylyltransferase SelO [Arhodomonas aquaeolei]|uniref:protein adenylyltransferase SelO n=1 Tax=Arhodomonas aquaeolei TaxID=2369 RepID=UPI000377DA7A|nr:YdiU family protein [Arhodomonas aquaeolei]